MPKSRSVASYNRLWGRPITSAIYRFLLRPCILMLVMHRPGSAIVSCTSIREQRIRTLANMPQSRLHPSVADEPPFENILTSYDKRHLVIYADLLETEADGGETAQVI
jgi:hypothetical protein